MSENQEIAVKLYRASIPIRYNVVVLFLVLALLRLLPFNFYASMLVGHEVVIDNREGNAINFINYISVGLLLFITLIKFPSLRARWSELWPFAILTGIYMANFILAPYVNMSWVLYQISFIAIAGLVHLTISGESSRFDDILNNGGFMIFVGVSLFFLVFVCFQLFTQFSLSYILEEYNDSFINSLNSFGVMKQYYGYVAGFLLLYSIFVLKKLWLRIAIIVLVLLSSFGIRSFVIGLIGVMIIHSLRSPLRLVLLFAIAGIMAFYYWDFLMMDLLLDTRFYAYMNAWDIIHNFPFGVGLGGYPEYTEIHNRDLFASFYNLDAALNYIPNSPESDIVHVFGSLGLGLGFCHLLIQIRLIILGIVERAKMASFERFMFYYFVFMTFFGISEDTMFTVSYWIFFGITSGIIATLRKRYYVMHKKDE